MITGNQIGKARGPAGWRVAIAIATVAVLLGGEAWAGDLLHARVSHDSGGALVKGSGDADWSYATVNTLILPGDTVWVDKDGILEVEMSGGSFLRLADASKAEIDQLPPSASVLAWTGSFYVQRINRSTGDFTFKTPAARVNVDKDTQVRVDVVGDGATTVSVRWGRVLVDTDGGAPVAVTTGYRVYVDPGLLPSEPMPFDRGLEDSFDMWNRERAKTLALGDRNLPAPIATTQPIGYSDLASYGDWVDVDNRTYWRPTVVTDYVPYRSGYWSYAPSYGYAWVGSYHFCYTTSHYGRWTYNSGYGWLWCYDPVWSPAWAVTVRYGDNFVWAPLDLYDQPCYYGGASFMVGDVRISIGASTYCSASNLLYYGPCATYPAYSNIFTTANTGDIYIWNINIGDRNRSSSPYYDSQTLVRDYAPQRVIRGMTFGTSTRLAADQAVNQLESTRGRAVFGSSSATAAIGRARGVRTNVSDATRSARIRSASVVAGDSLDPRNAVRRGQRNMAALRELDARPEGGRTLLGGGTRSPSADAASVPPVNTARSLSARTLRNGDAAHPDGLSNRLLSRMESADRSSDTLRGRILDGIGSGAPDRGERTGISTPLPERTPSRSLTRAARQPDESPRPDFSRVLTRTESPSAQGERAGRMTLPERTQSTSRNTPANRTEPVARTPWPTKTERSPLSSMSLPSRAGSRTEPTSRTTLDLPSNLGTPLPRTITAPPGRTETPTLRTPTPRSETTAPRAVTSPRTFTPSSPRAEAPQITSAPRREAPRTIAPAPRSTAPSPRFEAPRSVISENRSMPAPSRTPAPSFNVPRSAPSAPSLPSRVAPPAPRQSIPTPAPAPRIERPSVAPERPSFTPPSRSFDARPGGSAPSRSIERSAPSGVGGRGRR